MTMFLETICILNGIAQNLPYHEQRMQATARQFGFVAPALPCLADVIADDAQHGRIKCSITYGACVETIVCQPYQPRRIASLKPVEADIDYAYKYADREALNRLLLQKEDCDEILIIKNGYITDTTFANVVFENSHGLFTPATCLLNGTKRQQLIEQGIIGETMIAAGDLHKYDRMHLINAMLNLGEITIETKNIKP